MLREKAPLPQERPRRMSAAAQMLSKVPPEQPAISPCWTQMAPSRYLLSRSMAAPLIWRLASSWTLCRISRAFSWSSWMV